ncbi:MAG: response regulator [Chloroflexi bacterium]|nr:response regulator [Chloroflexota bacterium]
MAAKILIVDDEKTVLEMLADSLESQGYETLCASDGFEAMRLMAEATPDLIITDVQMPEMDGYLFTRYVHRVSDIPVMIITGVPQEAAVLREIDVGADSYMVKPIALSELYDRIAMLLSTRASAQTPDSPNQDSQPDFDDGPAHQPARITLDSAEIDQALQGGIPSASVTLVEGPEDSGKSVLCQHIASAAFAQGLSVAYYTSLASADDLSTQMSSLGLDIAKPRETDRFKIVSLAQLYRRRIHTAKMLAVLSEHMTRLFQEGANLVIFDDLTPAISDNQGPMIKFFERSNKMSRLGLTVISSFRSSISDRRLIDQLREIVDAHLSLSVEVQPKGRRMEVFNKLEVKKIGDLTPVSNNSVMFRVNRRLLRLENRSLEVVPITDMVS